MTAPKNTPDKPLTPEHAWQPFTPRGVAAFGAATLTRTVLAQLAVLLFVGFTLIWALRLAWVPAIEETIHNLPDTGVIRRGELNYPSESPARLAENRHLGFVVDLAGTREAGHVADIEITFEKQRLIARGPAGFLALRYDPQFIFSFNRPELEPWWGAWSWVLLALTAIAFALSLFVSWWALAFVYVPFAKTIAFFADRAVTWRGAWRMCAAALLPGACLVGLGFVLYGARVFDLFHFTLLYALHIVVGWFFVCTSPFFLPKMTAPTPKNPFGEGDPVQKNPFGEKQS